MQKHQMCCYGRTRCFTWKPFLCWEVPCPLKAYFELHERYAINYRSFAQLWTCQWRGISCLVPRIAYSTANSSKYTVFAFTIKKKFGKYFCLVAKNVWNIGRGKNHIHMTWKKQFHGTSLCQSPASFVPPAAFLNATWRQRIFSVMQAMKPT